MKPKSGPILSFNEKYIFEEKKGEGGFGKAFLIRDRETQKEYIAKCNTEPENEEKDKSFMDEIEISTILTNEHNPNIIQLKESGETCIDQINHKREKTKYMILEYAKNRELFDYIVYANEGFGESFGKIIF